MENKGKETLLSEKIDRLAGRLEAMRMAEYLDLLQRPRRLIWMSFLAGISRGLGIAVGATIVFAILIEFLSRMIVLNIPVIGNLIADIVKIVEMKQGKF